MASKRLPKRPIIVDGDIARVPLADGTFAIIETADIHLIEDTSWSVSDNGYVVGGSAKRPTRAMHRRILSPAKGTDVDHINGDKRDNRRANLREATRAQNLWNSKKRSNVTGYTGVRLTRDRSAYSAAIRLNGTTYDLGRFSTAEQAAEAYRRVAESSRGEFYRADPAIDGGAK